MSLNCGLVQMNPACGDGFELGFRKFPLGLDKGLLLAGFFWCGSSSKLLWLLFNTYESQLWIS
ncbi:MAG: hypothetical protein AB4426_17885 [Xenococcaceae cyanobacterium]